MAAKYRQLLAEHIDPQRWLEQHVFPKAGHLSIKELSAQQIIEILRPLEKLHMLETLSRLCQRINELTIGVARAMHYGRAGCGHLQLELSQPRRTWVSNIAINH